MSKTLKTSIGSFMLVMSFIVNSYGQDQQSFSLSQSIEYAIKNNTEILNAELENNISKNKVKEYLADGLPQVNVSLDMGRNLEIQRAFVPENAFNPLGNPGNVTALGFGVPNLSIANIRLEQMLFDGSFFIGLKAAKTYTEISRKQHIKSKIDVVEAVSKAYYSVLINYKMSDLITKNYDRLKVLLEDTKQLYENGFVEKIDVDRIKVQFNNAKVEYDHFQEMVRLSEMLLKYQMGLELDVPIKLSDDIESVDLDYELERPTNFNYDNRIEYSSLKTQQALNQIDLSNTKSQFYPKLHLYANYGGNIGTIHTADMFAFGDWYSYSTIGINAKWNVFDGFRKKNQSQQKKFLATQIENNIDTTKGAIELEIEQSLNGYNKNIDAMNSQKENMELAKGIYETTEIKYKEGIGSNSEVLDADASLKQAQTNYYNALYEVLVSKVELQKSIGELYK